MILRCDTAVYVVKTFAPRKLESSWVIYGPDFFFDVSEFPVVQKWPPSNM